MTWRTLSLHDLYQCDNWHVVAPSNRLFNALAINDLYTLGKIETLTDKELLKLPYFGKKCLCELHKILKELRSLDTPLGFWL